MVRPCPRHDAASGRRHTVVVSTHVPTLRTQAALGIFLYEKSVQGEGQGTQRQRHLDP